MNQLPDNLMRVRTSATINGFRWEGARITQLNWTPLLDLDEDAALRTIFEGTAKETGEGFFRALVKNLGKALHVHGAMVTQCATDKRVLHALAFWMDGQFVKDYRFDIAGTP